MNPFAHFAYGSLPPSNNSGKDITDPIVVDETIDNTESALSPPRKRKSDESNPQSAVSDIIKKKRSTKSNVSNKSSPEIMAAFWVELRSFTSNYPFAVLLTGVLGAQTRDIVTVGVMKQLAEFLGGDVCPLNISSHTFDELEPVIKRLNYCHKKTRSMMDLAALFRSDPVPSTLHGLKTVPGVGPVISEMILRVAYGAKVDGPEDDKQLDYRDRTEESANDTENDKKSSQEACVYIFKFSCQYEINEKLYK
mmetsp:Transcript_24210/g.41114  ORF Transcript_24210/g.41114 Transcript_24210/m.41114 type:complete len:251 (+) Transcript_24210:76-828(+)